VFTLPGTVEPGAFDRPIAGQLDLSMGGKSIALRNKEFVFNHTSQDHSRYDSRRRSIYVPVIRNHLYSLFEQFDFPDPTMPTGSRNQTTIPSQSLAMMNSDLILDCSDALATKLLNAYSQPIPRIQLAIESVYGRRAEAMDIRLAREFLSEFANGTQADASTPTNDDERQAWALYCQSLFASNEFIFVR